MVEKFFYQQRNKKTKKLITFANMEQEQKKQVRKSQRMTYDQAFVLNGKTPPQAVDIEEAVLGALMLDQNAIVNAIEMLHPDFFYKPEHQYIFRAIHNLVEKARPVDLLTVIEQLRHEGNLENAGGSYFIAQITNHVTSSAHVEHHARILSEKFIQRELIRISTETIKNAYEETTDVVQLLDSTEQKLMDINDNNFRSDYQNISDIVSKAMREIEEASEIEGGITGLPSGFTELDNLTAGFHPGTLIIIAARPAMGKTAFALTMMRNMAIDYKRPVAFFSMEMPATEIAMRLISAQSEIEAQRLKKGDLEPWMKEQITAKTQQLNTAPMYIDDSSQLSIFELRAKCRRLKQRFDIQAVFIDYLQLMKGETDNRNANREQEISNISRQLKSLSKELGIPIFALAQLSRAVETRGGNKEPQLSDLRESGAIEQDADMVMFLYRPEYYNIPEDEDGNPTLGLAKVLLAKHRAGGTGRINLRFQAQYARFENPGGKLENVGTIPPNQSFDQSGGYYIESRATSDFDDNIPDFSNSPKDSDDAF